MPDEDPDFVKSCLQHPAYSNESGAFQTEKLLSALLEDGLPQDLRELKMPSSPSRPAQPTLPLLQSRANIYDDEIDVSKLQRRLVLHSRHLKSLLKSMIGTSAQSSTRCRTS